MADTILQTYLNKQIIKTADDGNISNLKKAAAEIVKRLEEKKPLIIPYTLVAIDPSINQEEPVVEEVEKIIIKKWSAFKNSTASTRDKSTTYVRAVILEALSQLTKKEDEFAAIVWYTGVDSIKHYNLGKETDVIGDFLQMCGNTTEQSAQVTWGVESLDIQPSPLSVDELTVDIKPVSKKHLVDHLQGAAGNVSLEDESITVNSYWPNSNGAWASEFGTIAGEAITKAINSGISQQTKGMSSIKEQLDSVYKQLESSLAKLESSLKSDTVAANRRSELLWWKNALWSPTLNTSYRNSSPLATAIAMTVDLCSMVPPIYPHSVDFFLKETLKDVYGDQIDTLNPFINYTEDWSEVDNVVKDKLQLLISHSEGRKSLGTMLANKHLDASSHDGYSESGISKTTKTSLGNFAVWLFHNLQATKIAKAK